MCVVIFVTQTRWYDFFDESLHVMERLRKRQSLLVSPIKGRESCLEWVHLVLYKSMVALTVHRRKMGFKMVFKMIFLLQLIHDVAVLP